MGTLASSGLPVPSFADVLGTAIGAISSGASFSDVVNILAKDSFIALTPVGPLVAPLTLAGNLVGALIGNGPTVPVHGYLIDPTLPQPPSLATMKLLVSQAEDVLYADVLRELGRPPEYIEFVLHGEPKIHQGFGWPGTVQVQLREQAIEAWKEAVGVKGKKKTGHGGLLETVYTVTEAQLEAAGLDRSAASLYSEEAKAWKPFEDWATGVDARFRDGGGGGLEKLLDVPVWKARSIYWRLRYELARTGQPSPELLALIAQAQQAAYAPPTGPEVGLPSSVLVAPPDPGPPAGLEDGPPEVFVAPPQPPGGLGSLLGAGSGLVETYQGEGVVGAPPPEPPSTSAVSVAPLAIGAVGLGALALLLLA